jgi:hypothetical protein
MSDQTVSTLPNTRSSFFRGATVKVVFGVCKEIVAAIVRRRTCTALSRLDDYMLKDIGISRSEIDWIASQSSPSRKIGSTGTEQRHR